ncbi:MAG: hypothetical protein IT537_11135 [Hyphomicrobiales bacterium]|nr:hypothetical protein [Hyphomicrobiales bacterium]
MKTGVLALAALAAAMTLLASAPSEAAGVKAGGGVKGPSPGLGPRTWRNFGQYPLVAGGGDYPGYGTQYVFSYSGGEPSQPQPPEPSSAVSCQRSVQILPVPSAGGGTRTVKINRC